MGTAPDDVVLSNRILSGVFLTISAELARYALPSLRSLRAYRSELVAPTTEDIQFIEGEGVNVNVRKSKSDQEAEGLVKGRPYGSNKETCPVTALRQWIQAAEKEGDGPFEGEVCPWFYRGESIGDSAMTAQYVSTVVKRHAESAGLAPDEYSAHSLRAGFITQAICAGKAERGVKEDYRGHQPQKF